MSCPALDVNGNACRCKGPFCKFHDYMKDYTPEMITNSTLCTGCKKMKYLTHKNGLDRVDSSIGYIESNLQTCCGNCNCMKSNYALNIFLDKCASISNYYLSQHRGIEQFQEKNQIIPSNKMSKEQKREKERIRKQSQRDALRNKYGDEEYKKIHAKKIADQRKKSKEDS